MTKSKHFHDLLQDPKINEICRKNPLFWYSHLFKGIPWKGYDYKNLSRQDQIDLEWWHFKWSLLPEYDNHEWDGTPDPLWTIWKALADQKWVAVEAATSVGKTFEASIISMWFLSCFKGCSITVLGNSFTSMSDTVWPEIKDKWADSDNPKYGAKKLIPSGRLLETGAIICDRGDVNNAKWKLALRAVKKESEKKKSAGGVQGRHNDYMLFMLDEAATIPLATLTGVINTCTDPKQNLILALGNPDNEQDALHQFAKREEVVHVRISALDHPNLVCTKKMIGGGAVTKESVELRKRNLGEEDSLYKSRVRGISPAEGKNALIKKNELFSRWFKPKAEHRFDDDLSVGIDVANSEAGDKAGIGLMLGDCVRHLSQFPCSNAAAIVPNLILQGGELQHHLSHIEGDLRRTPLPNYDLPYILALNATEEDILVDALGVGESTVNEFKNFDWDVSKFYAGISIVNNTDYDELIPTDENGKPIVVINDIRTLAFFRLVWDLRTENIWFDARYITEQDMDDLYAELSAFALDQGASRAIKLESKRETKKRILGGKSPNLADALILANFHRWTKDKGGWLGVDY